MIGHGVEESSGEKNRREERERGDTTRCGGELGGERKIGKRRREKEVIRHGVEKSSGEKKKTRERREREK